MGSTIKKVAGLAALPMAAGSSLLGGGGKGGDTPAAPDYTNLANQQARLAQESAEKATQANRINQTNPFGSIQYTRGPDGSYSQNVSLNPELQGQFDTQNELISKYQQGALSGDLGLGPRIVNPGQTAQEAIMSRLQPQLAQQEESLRARLANQGIGLGSEAYGREQALAGQRANDLQLQAALQGITVDQNARTQAMQEMALPVNLIAGLRSGGVQNPAFNPVPQQAAVGAPDLLGAGNAQYQAALDSYNAQQANQSRLGSTFGSIAGAGLGFLGGGLPGASLGAGLGGGVGAGLFSDRRLKTNIKKIGTHYKTGVNVYSYDYIWGEPGIGVMAQELEKVMPEAVFEVDGWKAVDYARL